MSALNTVTPRPFDGRPTATVSVPGSKSIANRALVAAALATGPTELTNVPDGDDTVAMARCLHDLGLEIERSGSVVTVAGGGGTWGPGSRVLHAALAGTTSRFVTALAALSSDPVTIDGHEPLRRRPFAPLHDALAQLGVSVVCGGAAGHLPVTVQGPPRSGSASISGDVSSQYVSALMLIGPYLPGGLGLRLTSPLVSRPYVELTAAVMGWFGCDGVDVLDDAIVVAPGRYLGRSIEVEADASSASYPMAVAAVTGGTITIAGLGAGSLQGDAAFARILSEMGCTVSADDRETTVRGAERLRGVDIDMADVSDLVPSLAVVAAMAATPTRIRGVGFIRGKESDRLGDLARELRAAGVRVAETGDGLEIEPSRHLLVPARLETHHDHRLAMAFAVLSTVAPGLEIVEPGVVSKSWPDFWSALESLRP
ncbi:MAG: 3-phosphoshikimate 1-carboxyvinyltransferase [Ilumatobacteraceae bacterium]